MTLTGQLYINGTWTDGQATPLVSHNPATREQLWSGQMASDAQVAEAVAAAHQSLRDWKRLSVADRFAIIKKYARIAADHKEEMATLIANEMGKALWDARTEAGAIAAKADVSMKAYEERTPTRDNGATQLTHRPHGVMAVIGPFNFPGHLPNGHIIPALIAGNTIVFKPSEVTPAVAELMVRWWDEAGLPKGVVNLIHGAADQAKALITAEEVRGVLFTGGVRAGTAIHQTLGGHPDKIVALELGGNNPLVAWDVANADDAATIIARSAYITSGQRCTCTRRLIVPGGAEGDRIVEAVTNLIPRLRVGPALSTPEPFMGSLVSEHAAQMVLKAQDMMASQGSDTIVACRILDDLGTAFVSPGLIDTTNWSERKDEEVFGPLLQVIRADDFDHALHIANDTRFGLAAGLLSDDEKLWETFRLEIEAGIVNWNRQTTGASGAAPFGGPGLSGNHRPAGYYAADYCAWPMASMVEKGPLKDETPTPGVLA